MYFILKDDTTHKCSDIKKQLCFLKVHVVLCLLVLNQSGPVWCPWFKCNMTFSFISTHFENISPYNLNKGVKRGEHFK